MTGEESFALVRESTDAKEPEITEISLVFLQDGSVRIDGYYAGPRTEAFWGDWDHEFWLTVPASHARAFLALIARDAFTRDGKLSFGKLREMCVTEAIPFEEDSWS